MPRQSTIATKRKAAQSRIRTSTCHTIFNASPTEWIRVRACGVWCDIPPNGPGVHPRGQHEARDHWDGIFEIRDTYGATPEGIAQEQKEKGFRAPRNLLIAGADDVLSYILQNVKGVCLLTGDEQVDGPARREALREWVTYRRARAENTRAGYAKRIAPYVTNPRNAGKPAPPMNEHEIEAEEFLDALAIGTYEVDERPSSTYVCEASGCGYHTNDPAKFAIHMTAQHPEKDAEKDAPKARKGGRPKADAQQEA